MAAVSAVKAAESLPEVTDAVKPVETVTSVNTVMTTNGLGGTHYYFMEGCPTITYPDVTEWAKDLRWHGTFAGSE